MTDTKQTADWLKRELARIENGGKSGLSPDQAKSYDEYVKYLRSELVKLKLSGSDI